MMNAMIAIVGPKTTCGSFPRFSAEDVNQMWAEKIVDEAGYADSTEEILARHEHVERFFPTAEELSGQGIDIVKLAACLQADLIVVAEFGSTVKSLPADELNAALEHLLEMSADEAYRAHPHDAIDRAMHREGCCGCGCGC